MPPTILVRGAGRRIAAFGGAGQSVARYNNFVPLIYGTQWRLHDVVFSRNDGNLTRLEVLLWGWATIEGILKVLVNDIEIPRAVSRAQYDVNGLVQPDQRGVANGVQPDANFGNGQGVALGDPYGSMAYLSVVLPNRMNDGTSIPAIQVLDAGPAAPAVRFRRDLPWRGLLEQSGVGAAGRTDAQRLHAGRNRSRASFARAAAYCGRIDKAQDPVGGDGSDCPDSNANLRSSTAAAREKSSGLFEMGLAYYLVLESRMAFLEARIENTFALQQAGPSLRPATPGASFNGGWPAYEFDAHFYRAQQRWKCERQAVDKGAQDTANRLSIEFQDAFNQYQQDSLSLSDGDDVDLCGQEVAATWDAVGISTFNQATRMLLLGLNRAIAGNQFVEFQTSVQGAGAHAGRSDHGHLSKRKSGSERRFGSLKLHPEEAFELP